MSIKHKVLKDFQFVTPDKKIIVLKAKTTLENYKYVTKNDSVSIERDVIDNNPDFFHVINWREELNAYIKQNKIPQPAILTKKLVPFIEEMFVVGQDSKTIEIPIEIEKVVEKIVPVEKIVEKIVEVPVEKIVEKIVEVPVNNQSLEEIHKQEIEIESRLKKLELKEAKIQEELNSVHIKESELIDKEKNLDKNLKSLDSYKEQLDSKFTDLELRESELQKRIQDITEKENNLSNFISKEKLTKSLKELANNNNQCQSISCIQLRNNLSNSFVDTLLKS
jgi:hypothetical protein